MRVAFIANADTLVIKQTLKLMDSNVSKFERDIPRFLLKTLNTKESQLFFDRTQTISNSASQKNLWDYEDEETVLKNFASHLKLLNPDETLVIVGSYTTYKVALKYYLRLSSELEVLIIKKAGGGLRSYWVLVSGSGKHIDFKKVQSKIRQCAHVSVHKLGYVRDFQ